MNLPLEDNENTNFDSSSERSLFSRRIYFYVIIIFLFILSFYYFFFSAPNAFPKGIIVNIEQGENLRKVSFDLKEKKVIRSRIAFESFVILYGGEKHIAVGDYLFENKLPVFEIARRVAQKDRRLASIKITIPEGFDNLQITDLASSKLKNFNKARFLLKGKAGYLFPDTYFFFSSDTDQDVLKYMSDNFNRKIKTLESEINLSGKSKNDIIVMASLIEREAKGNEDRGYISGILWNRIAKKMPLQVDASPDTYKTRGLPEDPICNPGLESIKASIHPVLSNYLYYLHDKNGVVHYARSFEEHKKNKLRYLK